MENILIFRVNNKCWLFRGRKLDIFLREYGSSRTRLTDSPIVSSWFVRSPLLSFSSIYQTESMSCQWALLHYPHKPFINLLLHSLFFKMKTGGARYGERSQRQSSRIRKGSQRVNHSVIHFKNNNQCNFAIVQRWHNLAVQFNFCFKENRARMQLEGLHAQVEALNTLFTTSTASRPNVHLHPQLQHTTHASSSSSFGKGGSYVNGGTQPMPSVTMSSTFFVLVVVVVQFHRQRQCRV